jgi:excisionase family DNA binding protein
MQNAAVAYLTPAEAAAELRVSIATVYRMIRDRNIPVLHVRGQFRIAQSDLETALRVNLRD